MLEDFITKVEDSKLRSCSVSTRETHIATAKVGRDVIDDVEYITFDHSPLWELKEMKWYEKVWDVISAPYYKAKWKIKEIYWEVRYGFERMFKGYDSVDTFDTFAKFIDRYSKIIKDLRNCHYGYPGNITAEEWDNILDDMIYHLYYMDEWHVIDELEKNVPDNWSASAKVVGEIMEKHKNEFFKLFSEYFFDLWD